MPKDGEAEVSLRFDSTSKIGGIVGSARDSLAEDKRSSRETSKRARKIKEG